MASELPEIPGHILAEIFLRLPAPEDLARTSAACVAFRRLVTDGSFLRRFRRLHAPPLLAFLDLEGFHPAVPPHPSAPAAGALAAAADFTFSFLPSHCDWVVQDVRDGRLLLARDHGKDGRPPVFRELVVCDPLHRRYVMLPSVPEALANSVEHPAPVVRWPWCEPFLAPLGEDDAATAFSVICVVHRENGLAAFVFSSTTRQWQASVRKGWNDLFSGRGEPAVDSLREPTTSNSPLDPKFLRRHYAYGCFYWESTMVKRKDLLVLDTRKMEFSIADLPSKGWGTLGVAIVEAGEGKLGMFGMRDLPAGTKPELCYNIRQNKGDSSSQWQMVKKFALGSGVLHYIKADTERCFLLISMDAPRSSFKMPDLEYFSMDVKQLQLEMVCVKPFGPALSRTRIYADFPPSLLSSPTV
uniref:Uncharacterized protein n=1 Tax=Avena sativa TaxID=4498 RepID=A0ACD5ZDX2_AVESA